MFVGAEGTNTLKNSTVAVPGVGEVGSHVVEALARYGVGRLILADNDMVFLTNINRQSITPHSTTGQFGTQVMKEKIADICPGIQVITFEEPVLFDNIGNLFERMELQTGQGNSVGYIPDVIDTVTAKLALVGFTASHGIPAIVSTGTGNKLHPEFLQTSDTSWIPVCPLCKVMRRELKTRNISGLKVCWSPEQPPTPGQTAGDTGCRHATSGSIPLVPLVTELVIARAIIGDICGLERISKHILA